MLAGPTGVTKITPLVSALVLAQVGKGRVRPALLHIGECGSAGLQWRGHGG